MGKARGNGHATAVAPKRAARKVEKRPASKGGRFKATRSKSTLLPAQPETVELLPVLPPSSVVEVTLASDCSGLCTEGPAVRVNLPATVNVKHVYASEIEPKFRPICFQKCLFPNCFFFITIITLKEFHYSICGASVPGEQHGEHAASSASLV